MNRSQVHRLKLLPLKDRPLCAHALSWSCDAELAVATADAIYIFFPEYPSIESDGAPAPDEIVGHNQFSTYLKLDGLFRPDPIVNERLCELAGVSIPPLTVLGEVWRYTPRGVGDVPERAKRHVTGKGASICQIVSLEWSPNGIGANLRPVLTAMMTSGELLTLGEVSEGIAAADAGIPTRTTKMWRLLWGLGAELPIPDETEASAYRTVDDRIKSFSWAKEMFPGKCLLAYATDESDVVIMNVRRHIRTKPGSTDTEDVWEVGEVARFDARGPHESSDDMNPDLVPTGTAHSLSWSPWTTQDDCLTAVISYIAHDYVGFRKIMVKQSWRTEPQPEIQVAASDTASLCVSLSNDAFIRWENQVWPEDNRIICRGIVCTPLEAKSFQVDVTGGVSPLVRAHSSFDCDARWSPPSTTNPIAELVIHPSNPTNKSKAPLYSLVRSSVTWDNQSWYETNAITDEDQFPQWAETLRRASTRLVPIESTTDGMDSSESELSGSEDGSDVEDVADLLVHPYQFRIWGLALSPGGGSTAALVTRFSTRYPERKARSRLLFGWTKQNANGDDTDGQSNGATLKETEPGLSTEGRLWEWMYGQGPDIAGLTANTDLSLRPKPSALWEFFQAVRSDQTCTFCGSRLVNNGFVAKCSAAHSFAICSHSGIAVLAPGVSHVCAVCQRRCLKRSEFVRLAEEHYGLGASESMPAEGDACGACGGKFVA